MQPLGRTFLKLSDMHLLTNIRMDDRILYILRSSILGMGVASPSMLQSTSAMMHASIPGVRSSLKLALWSRSNNVPHSSRSICVWSMFLLHIFCCHKWWRFLLLLSHVSFVRDCTFELCPQVPQAVFCRYIVFKPCVACGTVLRVLYWFRVGLVKAHNPWAYICYSFLPFIIVTYSHPSTLLKLCRWPPNLLYVQDSKPGTSAPV